VRLVTIIRELLSNDNTPGLVRAINTFADLLPGNPRLGLDALTTVPEWTGFNTNSLQKASGDAYNGPSAFDEWSNLEKDYSAYKNAWPELHPGYEPYDMSHWLMKYYEDYTSPESGKWR
jgi:hypothetical protein